MQVNKALRHRRYRKQEKSKSLGAMRVAHAAKFFFEAWPSEGDSSSYMLLKFASTASCSIASGCFWSPSSSACKPAPHFMGHDFERQDSFRTRLEIPMLGTPHNTTLVAFAVGLESCSH